MYYFDRSLAISLKKGDKFILADVYTNIGVCYSTKGDYPKALNYFMEAEKVYEASGNPYYIGIVASNIGDIYLQLKKYKDAEKYLLKGLAMAEKIDDKEGIKASTGILSDVYAAQGDFKKAFIYNRRYVSVKDSLVNQKNQNMMQETQTKYETDKRDKEIELLNKNKELQQIIIEKQNTQRIIFITGIVLLLGFSFFIYRSYTLKKKDNLIIKEQKTEVEEKNRVIEEKQKEILDSIRYAKRIQTALITNEKYIEKNIDRLQKNDKKA